MKLLWLLLLFVCIPLHDSLVKSDETFAICAGSILLHEAENQSVKARRAVLDVLYTRMNKQGKSCREIVLQRKQFSYFREDKIVAEGLTAFVEASRISSVCRGCTHFHSGTKPYWAKKMKFRKRVHDLYFYQEK